jgi:hypothetical protein
MENGCIFHVVLLATEGSDFSFPAPTASHRKLVFLEDLLLLPFLVLVVSALVGGGGLGSESLWALIGQHRVVA